MTIPKSICHLVNPGTEEFIEKHTQTLEDVFRVIAEDRLRNLACTGGFKEAREIGLALLKEAANTNPGAYMTVAQVMETLGLQ